MFPHNVHWDVVLNAILAFSWAVGMIWFAYIDWKNPYVPPAPIKKDKE